MTRRDKIDMHDMRDKCQQSGDYLHNQNFQSSVLVRFFVPTSVISLA